MAAPGPSLHCPFHGRGHAGCRSPRRHRQVRRPARSAGRARCRPSSTGWAPSPAGGGGRAGAPAHPARARRGQHPDQPRPVRQVELVLARQIVAPPGAAHAGARGPHPGQPRHRRLGRGADPPRGEAAGVRDGGISSRSRSPSRSRPSRPTSHVHRGRRHRPDIGDQLSVADLNLPRGVTSPPGAGGRSRRTCRSPAASTCPKRKRRAAAEAEAEAAAEAGEDGARARALRRGPRASSPTPWPLRRKQPAAETPRGASADLLVVGLGNPGEEYDQTRHNVGAEVVELLARRHGGKLRKQKERSLTDEVNVGGKRMALAIPLTYMNLSGEAVAPLVRRYRVEPAGWWWSTTRWTSSWPASR